ncbi:MAG: divergent polysaccharide deacetylase family protein [Deltaproteobacteria bacterium]|nr:divergent polysaccharide deacetylase family protein [Deltaproteobacteria bacterium]
MRLTQELGKRGRYAKVSGRSLGSWICIFVLFAVVVFAGYSLYRWVRVETAQVSHREVSVKKVVARDSTKHESVKSGEPAEHRNTVQADRETVPETENRIAVVIDDMGYDLLVLDKILQIDAPITVSILPHLSYSILVAERANKAGREVILHLPMEPYGYPGKCPGSGALLLQMDRDEIVNQLEEDIKDVPHLSGVNNHMGSKFMEDGEKVEIVLDQLKKRGLFFLDSLTTKSSKGIQVAKKIGLRHVGRDIFLDNDCGLEETLDILNRIAKKQDSWRTIVIIGHPHESTIQAIRKALPIFRHRNIHIVPLSDLVQ